MITISHDVVKILEQRGLLPKHCRLVQIEIPPSNAMIIRFEVFITDDVAAILADAFAQIAKDGRRGAAGSGVTQDGTTPERMR